MTVSILETGIHTFEQSGGVAVQEECLSCNLEKRWMHINNA